MVIVEGLQPLILVRQKLQTNRLQEVLLVALNESTKLLTTYFANEKREPLEES